MVITQSDLCKTHMFYKYGQISGPKRSPDVNCITKTKEYLPVFVDLKHTFKKSANITHTNLTKIH